MSIARTRMILLACLLSLGSVAALADTYRPVVFDTFALKKTKQDAFTWRVVNNFRTIASQSEQDRYYSDMNAYFPEARLRCWGGAFKSDMACIKTAFLHAGLAKPTLKNYETAWRSASAQFAPGWATDTARKIELRYGLPAGIAAKCQWKLDGMSVGSGACFAPDVPTALGKHRVEVHVIEAGGKASSVAEPIEVTDVLILALGDSYGAGEGAPTVLTTRIAPAQWMDKRCHNSLYSGFAVASARYAMDHPTQSVTFLSYACSGGEIDGDIKDHGGILSPYVGRETYAQVNKDYDNYKNYHGYKAAMPSDAVPFKGNLPPQLDRAVQALCPPASFVAKTGKCTAGLRHPDFVLVSTGGNEVGFGPNLTTLATKLGGCDGTCQKKIKGVVSKAIAHLPSQYDALGTALKERLSPKAVLLTEYPNPVQDETGNFCSDKGFSLRPVFLPRSLQLIPLLGMGIKSQAAEFAHKEMLGKLEPVMSCATKRNAWTYVDGITAASNHSGYCSRRRWYQPYDSSFVGQGKIPVEPGHFGIAVSTGAMHPNMFGYSVMGDAVYHAMKGPTPGSAICAVDGAVRDH